MGTSASKVAKCDPCQNRKAVSFCTECRKFYCTECSSLHQSFKATRKHTQVYISTGDQKLSKTVHCEPCRETNKTQSATFVCVECRELYCQKCSTYHGKIKATRDHIFFQLSNEERSNISGEFHQSRTSSPKPDFSGAQVRKDPVVDKSPSNSNVKTVDVTNKSLKLTYCKEFSPRIPSDTKESFYFQVQRMLTLPDDRVVVLDGENDKLKLFSADYQIIHYCDVFENSVGLTLVDDTTLAVSSDNIITLYTVHTDRIQKSKSIKRDRIGGTMYDTCYKDYKFVCLTYHSNKWCIDVVDMEGHSKTILTEKGELCMGNHIITGDNCFYITTSTGEVRCLTLEGSRFWVVPGRYYPYGMSFVRGRLLVVEYGTGKVLHISLDGKLHDQPVLQGLNDPYCICYQQKSNIILLSSLFSGAQIKVYQVD